ncbi:Zn(2)-C6 fungal-type domain-containing protein [Fusarium falciforme]|uniref:Zn(2)-C6 fungal-type domain-containing protein n=1 Tax=Fusarium falciforme TaxID=195108 RepID=UPI0022FFDDEF|nr:Zn(2)-C6 fungal-type domain-containing protein [Fusarium falciforme]WAO92013.1 Zn(2)-C6 fungal-type domain-containing protein [Fusarium falciforme]
MSAFMDNWRWYKSRVSDKPRICPSSRAIELLCQPKDYTVSSFDVVVLGRSLEAKHADKDVDIFIPIVGGRQGYTDETYCGAPIIIRKHSAPDRRCTFGGIIKAVSWNGDAKLYGLTVGHVLLDDLDYDLTIRRTSNGTESLNNCKLQLSDSESEDESDGVTEQEPEETRPLPAIDNPQLGSGVNNNASAPWVSSELGKIGRISEDAVNMMGDYARHYYDWALIEMD